MGTAVTPQPFQQGPRLIGGEALNNNFAQPLYSTQDTITATAGGGQANAFPLTASINRLSVVATAADSVKLPVSKAGMRIVLINDGANAAQVFGAGTDTIDGVASATGVAVSAAKRVTFYCTTAGLWSSLEGVKAT